MNDKRTETHSCDCISRQDAIQTALDFIVEYLGGAFDEDFQRKLIERMNALSPAQLEPEWIPVSERLPEKAGKYLVTVTNGNVYAGTFDKFSGRFQCAAVAWMPLPEPYKEGEQDD